jgi:hypothetical protein
MGGYAQDEKYKPNSSYYRQHLSKPSAFESEIHPSHKTAFYAQGYFALPGAKMPDTAISS